jgi:hypothetical protein
MRRLFATYIACILLAAGTGYASIASNYNHDIATFQIAGRRAGAARTIGERIFSKSEKSNSPSRMC